MATRGPARPGETPTDAPAPGAAPTKPRAGPDAGYRPTSGRQRLVIVLLAVATALGVVALMLEPHLRYLRADHARKAADPPRCRDGQTEGCVGGAMGVIVAPPK